MEALLTDSLEQNNFRYFGKWVAPTLAWSLGKRWSGGKLLHILGVSTRGELVVLDGNGFYTARSLEDIDRLFTAPAERLDKEFFDRFLSLTDDTFGNFTALLELPLSSDAQERLTTFFAAYEEVWCPWMTAFFASKTIERELVKQAHIHGIAAEEILSMVRPFRKNLSTIAREEMWTLKQNTRDNLPPADAIAAYVSKYEWIGTHHFWGEPLTRKRFNEEFEMLSLQDAAALPTSYPPDLRFLLEQAGVMAWARTEAAELSAMVSYKLRPLFLSAAQQLGIAYDDLIFLHQQEILDGLAGAGIAQEEIARRKKIWGGYFSPEKIEMFSEEKIRNLLAIFIPAAATAAAEVLGKIACRGKAIGRARVVFLPHEVKDFKEGDILIAPETAPDYLPLMHKAGAIVTDRGGITSHAAITARELGKPCIIGTETATEIFRDGETVEVDAERGVVRKV